MGEIVLSVYSSLHWYSRFLCLQMLPIANAMLDAPENTAECYSAP